MTAEQQSRINRILSDIFSSIENDVHPMIQPSRSEGGYFGVPRMLLCYVDFLGLLLEGWSGKRKKNGDKDDFATTAKAKIFIKKVMSKVDESYETNGDLLYDMYRHGTVHIYSPKKMVSREYPGRTIEWLLYKGDRELWDYYENRSVKFKHLKIVEWEKNRYMLPVSITILYKDVLVAIDLFGKMIKKDKSGILVKNILTVADALDQIYDGTNHRFWEDAVNQ